MKKFTSPTKPYTYFITPILLSLLVFVITALFMDPWFISLVTFIISFWVLLIFSSYRNNVSINLPETPSNLELIYDPANAVNPINIYNPANPDPNSIFNIGKMDH